jgi:hypothetical protein
LRTRATIVIAVLLIVGALSVARPGLLDVLIRPAPSR